MKTTVKKHLLVALCAVVALTTASQTSHAYALFNITGVPQNGFTYGTAFSDDNVINSNGVTSTGSTVIDPGAAPSTWLGSGLNASTVFVNSMVTVTGLLPDQGYSVTWIYVGSESNDVIRFTAPGGAITTNEDNRNNNCTGCNQGPGQFQPTVLMGSTAYNFGDLPVFTVTDTNQILGTVTNGGGNPAPVNFFASLIFSYATFDGNNWTLTGTSSQFVVFGFNDNGFGDDNHDDFVGVMAVVGANIDPAPLPAPTPLPAALPLFTTGLGALGLLRWRRKRKAVAIAA